MDDCLSLQFEEVEALSAIYGEEWCVVDEAARIYCIRISDSIDKPELSVCLQVIMSTEYPVNEPPIYELNAPWLRGSRRREICGYLEEIYSDNLGESIIYLWVERIREFLQEYPKEETQSDVIKSQSSRIRHTTEEEEESVDDDFDLSIIQSSIEHDVDVSPADNSTDVIECPHIYHGEPMTERRSTFQSHLAPVFFKEQIKMVLDKLYENKKIANATHNIMAYRILRTEPSHTYLQGCDDDGEIHAGSRVLHMMQITDVKNVIVVVTRWYGGILLGPDRFKLINNSARQILEEHGYIKDRDDKKGPKSGNKKTKAK